MNTIKPGVKTTEFWVHNVLQIASVLAVALGQINARAGACISTILAVTYIAARAAVKFANSSGGSGSGGAGVATAPEAGAAVVEPERAHPGPSLAKVASLALVVMLVGVALAGCAQNLYARWAQANDSYDAALASLHALRVNGGISRRQEARVAAYMPAAEAALNAALADAKSGNGSGQKQDLQAFNAALAHLQTPLK